MLDRNPAYETVGAYAEPLGFGAVGFVTKYWTAADSNTLLLPVAGVLLWNRLLTVVVGLALLGAALATFRFADKPARKARRAARLEARSEAPVAAGPVAALPMPRFDRATAWAQLGVRTRLELGQVFRSPAYLVLMALGLFNAVGALLDIGELFGTPVLPVTRVVIRLLEGSFGVIPIIISIYYAGELVWRERERKTHEIIDASAIPDWAYVVPKALAVVLVLLSTLAISVVGGMMMQLYHGYTHFELGKYLLWYVLPDTVTFTLFAVLAVFLQAISPHKFVGWGLMVLYFITTATFRNLGWGDVLYNYAQGIGAPLSDMNGAGRFWIGQWWTKLYWSAFAVILLVLAHALGGVARRRGCGRGCVACRGGWRGRRVRSAAPRWRCSSRAARSSTPTPTSGNAYRTPTGDEAFMADYEKTLLRYEGLPQPSVAAIRLAVDLRPRQPGLTARGQMLLVNRTAAPISDVHVRLADRNSKLASLTLPGARVARAWPRFAYTIYHLDRPLAPGGRLVMSFVTERTQHGFRNSGNDTRVVENGTFVDSSELQPTIGMDRNGLLSDRSRRRKYGLTPELRPAKLDDVAAQRFNELHADWIRTDITVATDADQTPIAPGDKVSDTIANGRRTARYVTTAPILDFYSIQSARYAERHRMHDGIDLAVYYDPQHGANVDRMLAAFAHGLDYYQPNFAPYQFHQARIIEFPDYAQFAQAFAGTMPYSEGIGFIADLSDPDKIDYVTYVATHELGHQWWAHQAVGADMQGATMLTETLAQYSALMVMEHLYGRDQMRRFLKFELDRYLKSRGGEAIEELPLARVENQQYIHYRKGSVVMYRLKDELGEARVDAALHRYVTEHRFKGAPYPRSLDLIAEFRRGASPAENALITDLFERITLYDIKTKAATVTRRQDGRWQTALTIEAHKLYADGKGKETEAPMNEVTEVGLFQAMPGRGSFNAKDVTLLRRVPVRTGTQTVTLVSARRPAFAGADPYNVRIDRNSDDNVIATTGG